MSPDPAAEPVRFSTKIAVNVADDLAVWQRLNVAAFLVSGIAGVDSEVVGEPYRVADALLSGSKRRPAAPGRRARRR